MPQKSSFHQIWASIGVLGSTVVLINFFLPYASSSSSMSYTPWNETVALASLPVIAVAVLYWLAILVPMGAALRVLLGGGTQDRAWFQSSVVLAILGFLMSVLFDWLIMSLAGCCVPSIYHGGASPPSPIFGPGPDFWLAPIGFLLSLGSCSFFLSQKAEIRSSNTPQERKPSAR
jgi:hypothetical protein